MLSKKDSTFPIIVDAQDLLEEPKKMLIKICQNLNVKFDKKMLSWPTGFRQTDGIWGKYWYKQVEASVGFKPYVKINRIIPSKYSKGDLVSERGRLLSSDEYLTPDEILKNDPFFKIMRT